MTIKIFLFECSAPHWIPVSQMLAARNIHVSYWTCWNKLSQSVKDNFPSCIFHDTLFAKRALDPSGKSCASGCFDGLCETIWREDAQVVYDMMNRFDHSRDMTHVERSTFFYQCLVYWVSIFRHHAPDMVVFSAPPHVVYDYIALCVLRRLGVKTLMFEEIPCLPPYSICMNDYRSGLKNFKLNKSVEISDTVNIAVRKMQGNYKAGIPKREEIAKLEMFALFEEGINGLIKRRNLIAEIDEKNDGKYNFNEKIVNISSLYKEKGLSLRNSFEGDFANTRFMDQLVDDRRISQNLLDCYNEKICGVEFLKDYIYFPLAGQPERTSSPQADIFSNQILVANLLSFSIPSGYAIAVKEHPNQFHPNFAVNMCRSVEYYQELQNIPSVAFVSTSQDSFDLIDHSFAVATTGGTAGIEAIARGKPVLLFGDAWYRDCPGVFRVSSREEATSAILNILAGKVKIHHHELMIYLECLAQAGFRGIADYPPEDFPIEPSENIQNLTDIIVKECESFV